MRRERGDTIIEVILAVTIFSFVAISALTLMNNGLSMAQRSVEITLVRQQIDSQAEMLRYLSQSEDGVHQTLWRSITGKVVSSTPVSVLNRAVCPASTELTGSSAFALVPTATGVRLLETLRDGSPNTYAKVTSDPIESQGISIQLVRVSGGHAYDAYIQACWDSPGSSQPMTIGTIVRIYEPGL